MLMRDRFAGSHHPMFRGVKQGHRTKSDNTQTGTLRNGKPEHAGWKRMFILDLEIGISVALSSFEWPV
jgi:hypothetical protein